jgi:hypothetical protein
MSDVWYSGHGREARHKLLRLAADGDDPEMAEMAQEVLSGRVDFRDILSSSAYSEILQSGFQSLVDRWEGMSENERTHAQNHADELLAEAIAAIEEIPDKPLQTGDPVTPNVEPEEDNQDFEQRTNRQRW